MLAIIALAYSWVGLLALSQWSGMSIAAHALNLKSGLLLDKTFRSDHQFIPDTVLSVSCASWVMAVSRAEIEARERYVCPPCERHGMT